MRHVYDESLSKFPDVRSVVHVAMNGKKTLYINESARETSTKILIVFERMKFIKER